MKDIDFDKILKELINKSVIISSSSIYGFVLDNEFICKFETLFLLKNYEEIYDNNLTIEQKINVNNIYNKLL